VVQALSAECPDDAFGNRVRTRRSNGCGLHREICGCRHWGSRSASS